MTFPQTMRLRVSSDLPSFRTEVPDGPVAEEGGDDRKDDGLAGLSGAPDQGGDPPVVELADAEEAAAEEGAEQVGGVAVELVVEDLVEEGRGGVSGPGLVDVVARGQRSVESRQVAPVVGSELSGREAEDAVGEGDEVG
eukprot:scaffold521200_cov17-Prasinocladus_malaysianus.AAC.1